MNSYLNPQPPKPTKKQMKLIRKMESYGVYKFTGTTVAEAAAYIDNNMKFFKEQKRFMG